MTSQSDPPFEPIRFVGNAGREESATPIDGGAWYVADSPGDALVYEVADGALADAAWLTADALLDGTRAAMFRLRLCEDGHDGSTFELIYGLLNQCQARIRLPLDVTDGGHLDVHREGAWCKPSVAGDRVDLDRVDRVEIAVSPFDDRPVRWCQTPLRVTDAEPPRLTDPALPDGPLLDEFGQSAIRDWDGRTESEGELLDRLRGQRERSADREPTGETDDWGGWTGREFEATGFFRIERDGNDDRWWLVTPDGHSFWSSGVNGVQPSVRSRYDGLEEALSWLPDEDGEFADAHRDHWTDGDYVDYLVANLIRGFGPDEWRDAWREIALGQLRRFGFNTVGNWSDWGAASEAGIPYVRSLELSFPDVPTVSGNFPDVYHERFPAAAADLATDLETTVGDPAMVGYFLGNQPNWGFGEEPPAAGMLRETDSSASRRELADWLADEYGERDDETTVESDGLADAWEMDVTLDDVRERSIDEPLTDAARADLRTFSSVMVDRLYAVVCDACRSVDPDHLILGSRFAGRPPDWALDGLDHVDVCSVNCYRPRVPDEYADVVEAVDAPLLVGEFHFGALDAGLPYPGKQPVGDQSARGDAFRVYLEDVAAKPWCVGAHYYELYDGSALGRFDGLNANDGLLDVCHRAYRPLATAARASHERLYGLATGEAEPYGDEPEYLMEQ